MSGDDGRRRRLDDLLDEYRAALDDRADPGPNELPRACTGVFGTQADTHGGEGADNRLDDGL